MDAQVLQVLVDIFISVGICGIIGLFAYFKTKKNTLNIIHNIKSAINDNLELALLAVFFIQKTFKDLNIESKYLAACENMSERANKLGYDLTDEQIKVEIDRVLDELGDEFKKQWVKI